MNNHREETEALLRLSLCKGVSTRTVYALLDRFESPVEALAASVDALIGVDGVSQAAAASIRRGPDDALVEQEIDLMRAHGVRLVPFLSDDYPAPLRHLDRDAPVLLRVRGEYLQADRLAVAVVGARRCSAYGRDQASRIACDLASMGFTVVSGLAYGVDSAAHRGALLARGRTLAVLGCGLGRGLPEQEAELAQEIVGAGALLSELPMMTPPLRGNFPPRNRIISGLSLGVVVVEAAKRSGSLITARLGAEQGRAVFAVPGSVASPTSRGCHRLIRDGAVLVESARDVVEGLGPLSEPLAVGPTEEQVDAVDDARVLALNARERRIFDLVGPSPMHVDEVISQTELPPSIVSSTLLTLEIRGLLRQLAGQRYVRN